MSKVVAILLTIGVALSFIGLFAYTYGYNIEVCPNSTLRGGAVGPCHDPEIRHVKPYSANAPLVVIVGIILVGISVRVLSS